MTVSTTTYSIQYSGDGSTVTFSVPFEFTANGDLVVQETVVATGVTTTKTLTTDYSVSGAGNDAGGSVTMVTAPASGVRLTIYRDTTITQATDYTAYDNFPEESHEQALDKLTLIAQEVDGRVDRAIRFRESEDRTGGTKNSFLPSPVEDRVLGWDSDGNLANIAALDVINTTDITTLIASGDKRKKVAINNGETDVELVTDRVYTAGGTADVITAAHDVDGYNLNEVYRVLTTAANTGACTLNINSLGAKAIKLPSGSDPSAGHIGANRVHTFWYDGTNMVLLDQQPIVGVVIGTANISASAVTTAKIADANVTAAKLGTDIAAGVPVLLETITLTATASINKATFFTSNSSYRYFTLELYGVTTSTGSPDVWMRLSNDGSTFISGAGNYDSDATSAAGAAETKFILKQSVTAGDKLYGVAMVANPAVADKTYLKNNVMGDSTFGDFQYQRCDNTSAKTGYQLLTSSQTFAATGTVKVYGSNLPTI